VLAEAARVVHGVGGKFTAHTACREAIDAVLVAGFDAVEHGTLMRPDRVDALAGSGAVFVPTLVIAEGILDALRGFGGHEGLVATMRRALGRGATSWGRR
jgi:imidazolonepropionase-like amidohydrolase